ncbi:MAG TPA: hypothetical protein PKK99_02020 [Bacteroidia bacterium]|nr:hypothetical protein [Bacteroidia bacterium]HNP97798.1 hypothetical protein [Bacteroidia bacterium]
MSLIKKISLFVLLSLGGIFHSSDSHAQVLDTLYSSLEKKPKFFINILNYYGFISKDFANFSGLKFGLNYNKRVRFGFGVAALDAGSVVSSISIEEDSLAYTTNGELKFSFLSASAEYVFYHQYPWQFSIIPYNLAVGTAGYEYIRRSDHTRVSTPSETVITFQPELTGQFSIFRWIGLGASFGYRKTLYSSKNIRENFNSPTFSVGLKLFMDEIYKIAFPNGIGKKKKG